jgi:hypothetical protein
VVSLRGAYLRRLSRHWTCVFYLTALPKRRGSKIPHHRGRLPGAGRRLAFASGRIHGERSLEVFESISDPELNAWYIGEFGYEVADVCNRLWYDIPLAGRTYRLQGEYSNQYHACVWTP